MSDRRLKVADWLPPGDYAAAPESIRRRWLAGVAELYRAAKRRQIETHVGADGRPLPRVLPTSRPDGTTDRPLTPHDEASRTLRLLRVTENVRTGELVVHWGHWTRVVGYHAEGIRRGRGRVIRDVQGTPGRLLRPVKAEALRLWARLYPIGPLLAAARQSETPARDRPSSGRSPVPRRIDPNARTFRLF